MTTSSAARAVLQIAANDGPALGEDELRLFQELVYREAGIRMPDAKHNLVQGRLRRRLDALGLDSYRAYHQHCTAPGNAEELQRCLEALTTNETFFFRHKQHWDFLLEGILPAWRKSASPGATFRAWSAASSTGEEPYSLAIALAAAFADGGFRSHIDATDLNTQVLARARTGVYGAYALQKLTPRCLARYFTAAPGGEHRVHEEIRKGVEFRSHNLLKPSTGPAYDLVLLRNVLIYFDASSKAAAVANVAARLKPGGWLILGGAETITDRDGAFEYVRPTIYRKRQP
jgi:chemotaxis protein methyltransferase CheR